MTEEEAKEFMAKPLPDRFHQFMVSEICNEDEYLAMMKKNDYDYLPILHRIKKELPEMFFAYFNDLLMSEEFDIYQKRFMEICI